MSDTLHKLSVVIEGNNTKLSQAAREAIQDTRKMTDSINAELKKIQSPVEQLKKSSGGTDAATKKIREIMASIRNYNKEVQIAAGLKVYTDDYLRLGRDISSTEKELEKLRQKMAGMDESKRFVPTQEFKDLEKNIQSSQKALEKLNEQKGKKDKAGLTTEAYAEYEKNVERLDFLNKKLVERKKERDLLESKKGTSEYDKDKLAEIKRRINNNIASTRYVNDRLAELEKQGVSSESAKEYQQLVWEIERAEKKLKEYKDLRSQMLLDGSNLEESESFQKAGLAIVDAENKLRSYYATKRNMENSGQDVRVNDGLINNSYGAAMEAGLKGGMSDAVARIKEMRTELMNTIREIPVLGRVASEAAYIGSKAFGGLRSVFNKVISGIKTAGGTFSSLIQRFRSGIPGINRTRSSMNGLGNAGKGLGGILRTVAMSAKFMFASFLIRGGMNAAKEGMQNLAQYSDRTNASLSMLMSGLTQVKNSLATAFAPILNTVAPILSTLIDYLVAATTAIAHFFAALTGQKTFTVAKKVSQDFAGVAGAGNNANSAAKELKRTLMGFDEINKLDDDSGSGGSGGAGGGGAGIGDMFDTVEVDSKYQDLANQIKSYFQDIFQPMQDAWNVYGKSTVSAWKSALEDVLALLKDIALTFRDVWTNGTGEEVCGNILQILTQIGQAISEVAKAFKDAWDDENRGYDYIQSIFNRFNSVLNVIKTIGDSLLTVWSNGSGEIAIGNILDIFTNINNTIANIRNNFAAAWKLDDTGTKIIQDLADILNNMLEHVNNITAGLKSWANDLDLSHLLKAFNDLTTALKPLSDKVGAGLEWLFENVLQPLAKWALEQAIPAAIEAISGALDAINAIIELVEPALTWLWDNFLEPIAKWTGGAITTVLNGIGDGLKGLADLIDGFDSTEVIEVGVSLIKKGWETVTGWLSSLGDAAKGAIEAGVSLVKKGWSSVKDFIGIVGDFTANIVATVKEGAGSKIEEVKEAWNMIKSKAATLTAKAKEATDSKLQELKIGWESIKNKARTITAKFGEATGSKLQEMKTGWESIKSKVGNITAKFVEARDSKLSDIKESWSGFKDKTVELGVEVIDGIKEWWDGAQSWLEEKFKWLSDLFGFGEPEYSEGHIHNGSDSDGRGSGGSGFAEDGKTLAFEAEVDITKVNDKVPNESKRLDNFTSEITNPFDKISPTNKKLGNFTSEITNPFDKIPGSNKTLNNFQSTITSTTDKTPSSQKLSKGWDAQIDRAKLKAGFIPTVNALLKSLAWAKSSNKQVVVSAITRGVAWAASAKADAGKRILVANALTRGINFAKSSNKNLLVAALAGGIGWMFGADKGLSGILGYVNKTEKQSGVSLFLYGITAIIESAKSAFSNHKANGGIYSNGKWQPVTAAANGGAFSTGQMFIAREAGPELVGSIGRSTAVMNNNQIVSSVSAGVYQAVIAAMSQSSGQGRPVNVSVVLEGDAKGIFKVVKQENDRIVLSTGHPAFLT